MMKKPSIISSTTFGGKYFFRIFAIVGRDQPSAKEYAAKFDEEERNDIA
jgi:hypothetical protein